MSHTPMQQHRGTGARPVQHVTERWQGSSSTQCGKSSLGYRRRSQGWGGMNPNLGGTYPHLTLILYLKTMDSKRFIQLKKSNISHQTVKLAGAWRQGDGSLESITRNRVPGLGYRRPELKRKKKNTGHQAFTDLRKFARWKAVKKNDKAQTGRKYLQTTYLTKS